MSHFRCSSLSSYEQPVSWSIVNGSRVPPDHVVFHWPLRTPRRTRSECYQRKSPMCTSVLIKGNRFLCLPILPSLVIIVLFFLAVLWDMWDLSSPTSQPEIDSAPPTVKAQNLNCWISREVPILPSLVMPNSARELCTCSHNSDMSKFPPFIRIPGDEGPL